MTEQPTDPLLAQATLRPGHVAVVDDRPHGPVRMMTYLALNAYANRIANGLQAHGLRRGDAVVWCGKNSLEVLAFIHATRKAGLTCVPLNYRLSPVEARYIVADSAARLAWVDAEFAPLMAEAASSCPALQEVVVFAGRARAGQMTETDLIAGDQEPAAAGPGAGADCSIQYTSGTTGRPKGVVRRGLAHPAQMGALVQLIGFRADDVYLVTGPLYHSGPAGIAAIGAALGGTVVVQHEFAAEDWLRLVDRHAVSATFTAPTPIRFVCDLPAATKAKYDRRSMRRLLANAAPWSMALKRAYLADFPPESLWEIYGSTELGVSCVLEPPDQLRKPGSCGRPAPLVEIALFDDDGRCIEEPMVPGELYVRASSVFDEYRGDPEAYAASRRDRFQTVGDVAYRDAEGYYYICDRKSDMIITGGMNVYPAEVEGALEAHPGVFDVAVVGIPSDDWGEAVHAVVVRRDPSLTEAGLVAFARQRLAGYKLPRSVSFVADLPRTGTGKLLRRELRARYADHHGGGP